MHLVGNPHYRSPLPRKWKSAEKNTKSPPVCSLPMQALQRCNCKLNWLHPQTKKKSLWGRRGEEGTPGTSAGLFTSRKYNAFLDLTLPCEAKEAGFHRSQWLASKHYPVSREILRGRAPAREGADLAHSPQTKSPRNIPSAKTEPQAPGPGANRLYKAQRRPAARYGGSSVDATGEFVRNPPPPAPVSWGHRKQRGWAGLRRRPLREQLHTDTQPYTGDWDIARTAPAPVLSFFHSLAHSLSHTRAPLKSPQTVPASAGWRDRRLLLVPVWNKPLSWQHNSERPGEVCAFFFNKKQTGAHLPPPHTHTLFPPPAKRDFSAQIFSPLFSTVRSRPAPPPTPRAAAATPAPATARVSASAHSHAANARRRGALARQKRGKEKACTCRAERRGSASALRFPRGYWLGVASWVSLVPSSAGSQVAPGQQPPWKKSKAGRLLPLGCSSWVLAGTTSASPRPRSRSLSPRPGTFGAAAAAGSSFRKRSRVLAAPS